MKVLLCIFLTSCVIGSTTPEGRTLSRTETVAVQCVTDLLPPSSRTLRLLGSLGVLAGPAWVEQECQPNAASCALLLEGLIVYDGVHTGDVVHEALHFYDWYERRRVDYSHSDPVLWAKNGGEDSVEWRCRHDSFER